MPRRKARRFPPMRGGRLRSYGGHMKQDDHRKGATMEATATVNGSLRELAHRENDGIEVTLLWDERTDRLTVSVLDTRTGEFFELGAPRDEALDVFYHPYSHAARRGVLYTDALLAA